MNEKTKIRVNIGSNIFFKQYERHTGNEVGIGLKQNKKNKEVKVDSNSTVFDLAREVAKIFFDQKEKYIGFVLSDGKQYTIGRDKCKNQKISNIIVDNARVSMVNNSYIHVTLIDSKLREEFKDDDIFLWDDIGFIVQKLSYPLLRIIIGVIDLLLLVAMAITFSLFFLTNLSLSIWVPVVLTVLFIIDIVLFFGFEKIFPKSWMEKVDLKTNIGEEGGINYKNGNRESGNLDIKKDDIKKEYNEII